MTPDKGRRSTPAALLRPRAYDLFAELDAHNYQSCQWTVVPFGIGFGYLPFGGRLKRVHHHSGRMNALPI